MNKTDWIQTYTGEKFYPLEPALADIDIEDIAHSLSMLCRYNGHTRFFYSVAQHSSLVSFQMQQGSANDAMSALLHDASEAYLSDLPSPLKNLPEFAFYREAEERLQKLIYQQFGVIMRPDLEEKIKKIDREMIAHEAPVVLGDLHPDFKLPDTETIIPIEKWSRKEAKSIFMHRFYSLERAMKFERNISVIERV